MWCPILKVGELAAKSPAEKSEDHSDNPELIWENFTHEEKVNICWLPLLDGVLFKYSLLALSNFKELSISYPVSVDILPRLAVR